MMTWKSFGYIYRLYRVRRIRVDHKVPVTIAGLLLLPVLLLSINYVQCSVITEWSAGRFTAITQIVGIIVIIVFQHSLSDCEL